MDKNKKPWNYQADSIVKCNTCGKEFQRPKSKIGKNNYCSHECYIESKKKQVGELHPLYKRIEVTCDVCGKKYDLIPSKYERSKNHFCSLKCKYNWVEESQAKEGYKICSKCGKEIKATPKYFYRDGQTRDGLSPQCKKCRNAEIREKYPEMKAYYKNYQKENSEKIKEYRKKYYAENIDKIKANYEKNKDKYNVTKAIYYQKNKEKFKEYNKAYSKIYRSTERGRELQRIAINRRRSRLKSLPHSFTNEQWQECLEYFNHSCAYCGMTEEEHLEKFNELLHQEHFIALSKGGTYTKDNIIAACRSCNAGKIDKYFSEWYPYQEFYNKEREVKIFNYIEKHKNKDISKKTKMT